MTTAPAPLDYDEFPSQREALTRCEQAGRQLAERITSTKPHGTRGRRPRRELAERILSKARSSGAPGRAWVLENARLLHTAEKEALEFAAGVHRFPIAFENRTLLGARIALVAGAYLDCVDGSFSEESCASFLDGFQLQAGLEMGEIWALKPAIQLEILRRLAGASPETWPQLVGSLRRIGETLWKDLFETASLVHRLLASDPGGAYPRMDFDSRDLYRTAIGSMAKHSPKSELEIASAAVDLAREARVSASSNSPAGIRRCQAGYYLIDRGVEQLRERVNYRPPIRERVSRLISSHPTVAYLGTVLIVTLAVIAAATAYADPSTPVLVALLFLMLPATQAAIDFVNHLVTWLARPRVLPKLDFSNGIPADCTTMVAVPTLLLKEDQVRELTLDLEIRYLANRDPNLFFALLTDSPDSDGPEDERDRLVELCRERIEALNRRYPESPFFMFHRHRIYNDSEGRWMGWERKRGKLLDLNRVMRGGFDAFPVKVGNLAVLDRVEYVITLDSDTQLPRESAARLVGALAHPLNSAVVDPVRKIVVEGYGILQPRIGISIKSSARSRLAALYSGETGFDIYTRAVSDVYQDLFGEGIFTGKGIYKVDAMRDVLEHRFPENALLSHDLIEGAYARVALVSDIELIDDYPSHFSAYNRRKHRWVRGDWQILRWILGRVPGHDRTLEANPISLISRWKILDNLRRSLVEPGLLLLLLGSWFLLPAPEYWTFAAVAMLFLPVYWDLLFAVMRVPMRARAIAPWARDTARAFVRGHALALINLFFLLHQALLSVDAILRSILRVFVTKRKLLEWETAAEAESQVRSKATVDVYLELTPLLGVAIAILVVLIRPAAIPIAAPILILWMASRAFSAWMNKPPRLVGRGLSKEDAEWLRTIAEKTCRFFRDWSSPANNRLIPDSVREDGEAALRLSPTNVGMLLNADIAAVHLGAMTLAEFISETRETLSRLESLAKHRGHLYNWYDIHSLEPLKPRFVSTVDSGNLVASLWALKQAALAFAAESTKEAAQLEEIASMCNRLAHEMDFRFLYHPRNKVLSLGYDAERQQVEATSYDLMASEARIAVFVAIAKGDIPQEAWFHLGRAHTIVNGERTLLSWTGTMFEYLMPAIWMSHHSGTIMEQSIRAAVRIQQEYAKAKGVPWGISESACLAEGSGSSGYGAFGIPALALKAGGVDSLVISPYSAALALPVDPVSAVQNLREMEQTGWSGRYGFYEAIDYSKPGGQVIRSWMAHHQGMTLLSICNLLFDNAIQRYFHTEPQVLATELLLHERVPSAVETEKDIIPQDLAGAPLPQPLAEPAA